MRRIFTSVVVMAVIAIAGAAVLSARHVSAASAHVTGSAASKSAALESATLEKTLRDADLEFARQTAARRLDGWLDSFADDASIIHDGTTVSGTQALRAYYEPVFADKDFSLRWTPTKAEASKDGTLGYTFGNYEAKRGTSASRGMYTTVWRRVNGQWKVVLDLGSAAHQ